MKLALLTLLAVTAAQGADEFTVPSTNHLFYAETFQVSFGTNFQSIY
jgi:hypothetical protein